MQFQHGQVRLTLGTLRDGGAIVTLDDYPCGVLRTQEIVLSREEVERLAERLQHHLARTPTG